MTTEHEISVPEKLTGHANEALYADLDPVALQLALAAYSQAYDGSWPRAVVAAIRTYLREVKE